MILSWSAVRAEGFGAAVDGVLEVDDRMENAALDAALGQLGEDAVERSMDADRLCFDAERRYGDQLQHSQRDFVTFLCPASCATATG
jgi:hypothetical protein